MRVPGDHLIGGEREGWQVAQTTLEIEHGGRGAVLPRDEALDNLLLYVRGTSSQGEKLGDDPLVQQGAMEAYMESRINDLFSKRNYWMYQARQEMTYHGSQSAMFRKTYRMRNADRARDIMGMYSLLGSTNPGRPSAASRRSTSAAA